MRLPNDKEEKQTSVKDRRVYGEVEGNEYGRGWVGSVLRVGLKYLSQNFNGRL